MQILPICNVDQLYILAAVVQIGFSVFCENSFHQRLGCFWTCLLCKSCWPGTAYRFSTASSDEALPFCPSIERNLVELSSQQDHTAGHCRIRVPAVPTDPIPLQANETAEKGMQRQYRSKCSSLSLSRASLLPEPTFKHAVKQLHKRQVWARESPYLRCKNMAKMIDVQGVRKQHEKVRGCWMCMSHIKRDNKQSINNKQSSQVLDDHPHSGPQNVNLNKIHDSLGVTCYFLIIVLSCDKDVNCPEFIVSLIMTVSQR